MILTYTMFVDKKTHYSRTEYINNYEIDENELKFNDSIVEFRKIHNYKYYIEVCSNNGKLINRYIATKGNLDILLTEHDIK